jgi:glycosyltransferase involved in cell wall biosynthesis
LTRRIHLVGPLPPPRGGETVSFELFLDEVRCRREEFGISSIRVTDTSPGRQHEYRGLTLKDGLRGLRLVAALASTPLSSSNLIFFASGKRLLAGSPVLPLLTRAGVSIVVRMFGTSLATALESLPPRRRRRVVGRLGAARVIFIETLAELEACRALGVANAAHGPNFRRVPPAAPRDPPSAELRLAFVGLVSRQKGVHDLLEALALLGPSVTLDIWGELKRDEEAELARRLHETPRCAYRGIHKGEGASLLVHYDALVLPSHYEREGHAGVVLEAMVAGIPAIVSTRPGLAELVTDGENGLVVPEGDPRALARAIERLSDVGLREALGRANRAHAAAHDVRLLARELVIALSPSLPPASSATANESSGAERTSAAVSDHSSQR